MEQQRVAIAGGHELELTLGPPEIGELIPSRRNRRFLSLLERHVPRFRRSMSRHRLRVIVSRYARTVDLADLPARRPGADEGVAGQVLGVRRIAAQEQREPVDIPPVPLVEVVKADHDQER